MPYNNIEQQQQHRTQFSLTSSPVGVYKVSKNDEDPTSVMVSLECQSRAPLCQLAG